MAERFTWLERKQAAIAARELLKGTVCGCGDLSSDHAVLGSGKYGECAGDGCDCIRFRPVHFKVEVRRG